ncbi:hypothetical protein [Ruegeria arenilitoris]|uniref:hypothetical protein n=1 Tax=Ruegeria arenilitoris TaxID=1173585 RepID=UPI0020C4664E|nr:hypothetical protein [Ruegeria arenilitoris]
MGGLKEARIPFELGKKGRNMKIGTPKEILDGEDRVAMTPQSALRLQRMGYRCLIEKSAGVAAGFNDADYEAVGVEVIETAILLWRSSDLIAKVRQPDETELTYLTNGQSFISFFKSFGHDDAIELVKPMDARVIAMEMVPRIIGCDPTLRFV